MYRGFVAFIVTVMLQSGMAFAQPLGTFKWQLQSYCNVISAVVTQTGGVYTLDGFDDQCGAGKRAPVTGLATPNPDGTIGMGFNIVAAPGAAPVHVAASIDLSTLGGTWRDSAGGSGNFVFTPGVGTGGSPRPLPLPSAIPVIPTTIKLFADGGVVAGGGLAANAPPPVTGAGARMMWYAGKSAFRAGEVSADAWDTINVGFRSAAFGLNTKALGDNSAAFGQNARTGNKNAFATGLDVYAGGEQAFAQGQETEATGVASVALGVSTKAIGSASLAAGSQTTASGIASTAFGVKASAFGAGTLAAGTETAAIGDRSVVFGSYARTNVSEAGSFLFGDASTTTVLTAPAANSFAARAAGGVRFYTNAAMTAGAYLPAGSGSWSALSDVNMKENFRDLDGDEVLAKIARMPIREWNYKSQDAAVRHLGPTAQDFHAAFGLGEDSLRISTIDADGIALRAIQALEARLRAYEARIQTLEQEISVMRTGAGARR